MPAVTQTAAILILFILVAIAKSPWIFLSPRLWAEEAILYLNAMQTLDGVDSLLFVANANYQFLANLIVLIASRLPIVWAAHVTTYMSFAVAGFVAYLLIIAARQFALSWFVGLLLVLIWALLPQTYEVFATATNVQWVCSISILLICALDLTAVPKSARWLAYVWAIGCGLTGVPSCIAVPGFFLRATLSRSRPHLIIGLILAGCAFVQMWVILRYNMAAGRTFTLNPQFLVLPTLLHTVLMPLFGVAEVEYIGSHIRASLPALGLWATGSALIALAIVAFVSVTAWSGERRRHVVIVTLLCLWAGTSVINTFGAIGDPVALIGALGGGRYYLFGATAFALLLSLCTNVPNQVTATVAICTLCVIVVVSTIADFQGSWTSSMTTGGPSWRQEVERCGTVRPCRVTVWPSGWTFDLLLK